MSRRAGREAWPTGEPPDEPVLGLEPDDDATHPVVRTPTRTTDGSNGFVSPNVSDTNGAQDRGFGPADAGTPETVVADPDELVTAVGTVGLDLTGSSHADRSPLAASSPPRSAIPDVVIRRLPVYFRTLRALASQGVASVSSEDLADRIGVTAAQIRRDLSYFGRFGTQGKGYETDYLSGAIARILRLDRQWDVALAGLGNLGRAIINYRGFGPSSFDVVALFDPNPEHAGREIAGLPVLGQDRITDVVRERGIRIGIVAVRATAAQDVTDRMVAGGVQAILNYAPVVLKIPPGVTVREIDPVSALQSMTYYVDDAKGDEPTRSEGAEAGQGG